MEDHGMCPSTRTAMQVALKKAEHTTCTNTKAWALRRAMDVAYHSLPPL
jgi:hypothetical protein